MNEKIKNIFAYIGAFFVGVFTCLVGIVLHNRRTDDRTGELIDRAGTENNSAQKSIKSARQTVGDITGTVEELSDNVGRSRKIFDEIKKQKNSH